MAVKKFLNDSGLAYFWSKLKTYIRGATVSQSDVSDKAKTLYYGVTSNGTPSENEQVTTISGITSYFDGLTVVLTIGPDAQYIDSININSLGSVYIYNDDNFNNALLHGNATYTFMYQTIDNEPYFIKLNTELSNKIKYDQTITAGPRNVNVGDLIAYRPSYGYGGLTDGIVGMMGSHLPFRIDYPILFSGQELNIGETGNQNYICGRFDIGFSSYFEDSKAMYIVGRLNGLEFTPEILYYSMIMQTGEPESARDYDYFLLLGYWGHSDDEFYLVPNHDIYKLQNGVFKKYLDVTVDLSSYIVNEEPSQDVQTQVAPSYAFTKEMIKDIDKLKYNVTITAGPHNINENQFIVYRPTYGYSSFSAGIVGMAGSHLPFRIDYPILFSNESLAAGGTGNQNYICGKFDIGYSSYFEDSKALYLMGNVNGLEFKPTMYHSMIVLQTGEPTEESYDDYYLLLGYWGHTSDEFYLIPNHDIFCYLDGEFKRYIDSKIINSAPLYGDPSIVAPSYAFTKEMIDNIGCIPAGSVIGGYMTPAGGPTNIIAMNLLATSLVVVLAKRISPYSTSTLEFVKDNFVIYWGSFPVNIFLPISIVILIVSWFVLSKTRFGLRLSACGENPQSAASVGVNVIKFRYVGVLISGILAGLGAMA